VIDANPTHFQAEVVEASHDLRPRTSRSRHARSRWRPASRARTRRWCATTGAGCRPGCSAIRRAPSSWP